jgi:hypothetical protein
VEDAFLCWCSIWREDSTRRQTIDN